MSEISQFRSIAKQIEVFVTSLCPYLQKALALLLYGLLFGISHYALLSIASSSYEAYIRYTAFAFAIWCIFNINFNYIMCMTINPGNPSEIPQYLLRQINYKCQKCGVIKPPRTHHCSICNKCVIQMDHHCPWIGNCVGHHNRKYFVNFLTYLTLGLGEVLFFINYAKEDLMFALILTLFVCVLFFMIYHWYIVIKGKTSLEICWEDPRYQPNPSISHNIKLVFGTSNILIGLCPSIAVLKDFGYQWSSV